jgi:radical SAM superfamily enzyme YgiQ (UPF0313 family)
MPIGHAWRLFAKTILTSFPRCVWDAIANLRSAWPPRQARGVPIAAHGSDASDHVTEYLHAGFDSVLIGEVETTLLELAEDRPRASIHGLAYREGWTVQRNAPRELRTDLETLPLPAWDLVDMDPIPAGLAASARIFFPEHGFQPWMPVSLQLVRQADLRQQLPCARPGPSRPRCFF